MAQSTPQHTQGPWTLCPSTIGGVPSGKTHLDGPNGESVAIVPTHWAEGEANARLIAAAPALLATLRQLLEDTPLCDEEDGEHAVIDNARALLREVTGEGVA